MIFCSNSPLLLGILERFPGKKKTETNNYTETIRELLFYAFTADDLNLNNCFQLIFISNKAFSQLC